MDTSSLTLNGSGHNLPEVGNAPKKSRFRTVVEDPQWNRAVLNSLGVVARVLEFIGDDEVEIAIPFVTLIAISPFSFKRFYRKARSNLHASYVAARLNQLVNSIYFGLRGIWFVGVFINSVIKPFSGGIRIRYFSFPSVPQLTFALTRVFPIIQITLSGLNGLMEGWSFVRTVQEIQKLNKKVEELKPDSLTSMVFLVNELQNPTMRKFSSNASAHQLEVDTALYKDSFASKRRRKMFQNEVAKFQSEVTKYLAPKDLHDEYADEILDALEGRLTTQKKSLMQHGFRIIASKRSELHRKLFTTGISVLLAAVSVTSGILFFVTPQYHYLAAGLSLGSGVGDIALVLFEKLVSKARFDAFDQKYFQRNADDLQPIQEETLAFEDNGVDSDDGAVSADDGDGFDGGD